MMLTRQSRNRAAEACSSTTPRSRLSPQHLQRAAPFKTTLDLAQPTRGLRIVTEYLFSQRGDPSDPDGAVGLIVGSSSRRVLRCTRVRRGMIKL